MARGTLAVPVAVVSAVAGLCGPASSMRTSVSTQMSVHRPSKRNPMMDMAAMALEDPQMSVHRPSKRNPMMDMAAMALEDPQMSVHRPSKRNSMMDMAAMALEDPQAIGKFLTNPETALDAGLQIAKVFLQTDPAPAECAENDGMCKFVKRMKDNPMALVNAAMALNSAQSGLRKQFAAKNWEEFSAALQHSMWAFATALMADDYKTGALFTASNTAWHEGFTDPVGGMRVIIPVAAASFDSGVRNAWAPVISKFIATAEAAALAGSPDDADNIKQMASGLTGLVDSWEAFIDEDLSQGILSLWKSVNTTLWQVLSIDKDTDMGKWALRIDVAMTGASNAAEKYEQNKANGEFCVKKFVEREFQPITTCFPGFAFDKKLKSCAPAKDLGADCSSQCQENANCPGWCPYDRSWCCKKDDPSATTACKYANFVDLAFTEGGPKDYFQCVAPAIDIGYSGSLLQESATEVRVVEHDHAAVALVQRAEAAVSKTTHMNRRVATLERTTSGKDNGDDRAVENHPKGFHKPQCDPLALHSQKIAGHPAKCFIECAAGYEEAIKGEGDSAKKTTQCKMLCQRPRGLQASFGISDFAWEVCANSSTAVDVANNDGLDISASGVQAALSINEKWDSFTNEDLKGWVATIGDAVVHFTRPYCDFDEKDEL